MTASALQDHVARQAFLAKTASRKLALFSTEEKKRGF